MYLCIHSFQVTLALHCTASHCTAHTRVRVLLSAWTTSLHGTFFRELVEKRMGKSESQMDIMEKATKPGKRCWTVAEIGLSILLLLVSCALAGLIVLYTSVVRGRLCEATVGSNWQLPRITFPVIYASRWHDIQVPL